MSTGLQVRQSNDKLRDYCENSGVHAQLVAAIGEIMPADQFISHAIVAMQQPGRTDGRGYHPGPKDCSPASQLKCVFDLAAMGLLPTLGQVALIVRKSGDGPQVTAMPQWQGLKALMERHPSVLEVVAEAVTKTDRFGIENGTPSHSYDPFDEKRVIRGVQDIKGGYVKIVYTDGRPPKYHFVTAAHIDKCRKCAQTQDVWNKWPEQMILKTLYRDCYARRAVPMDPLVHARVQRVFDIEDANLGNQPMRIESKIEKLAERPVLEYEEIADGDQPHKEAEPAVESKQPPAPESDIDAEPEAAPPDDDSDLYAEFCDQLNQVDQVLDAQKLYKAYAERVSPECGATMEMRLAERLGAIRGARGQRSRTDALISEQ